MRRLNPAIILGLLVFAIGAPGASAATTLGQTFAPPSTLSPSALLFQTSVSSGNPSGVISAAGVITSFSHHAEATADSTLALVVLRPSGADYKVVAATDAKTLTSGTVNTFAARIPVAAGDIIGALGTRVPMSSSALGILDSAAPTGNVVIFADVDATVGSTIVVAPPLVGTMDGMLIDLSATVEADADGDGYGDETQDSCPSQKSTQGACDLAGPKLTVTAAPTQKTKTGFSFSAVSDEASSTTAGGALTYFVKKNGKKKKKTIMLTSITQSLTAGTGSTFTFKLSSKAKSALKTAGKLKAALTITSVDVLGNTSTSTLSLTIKRK